MYVGVDIGGTKTLVGVLDDHGVIVERVRFATPARYIDFIDTLRTTATNLDHKEFRGGSVAVPGKIDREHGLIRHLGNLPWHDEPLQTDAEKTFHCPIALEHDSVLGGLSESMLLPNDQRVLYVTISTGIGTGLIDHRTIVPELADSEGGQMLLEYRGKHEKWENFASGRAIVKRFGKKAADINDVATWQRIAHDLAQGFIELIAITQPDIIIIGGSVGRYFERFKGYLVHDIAQYQNPLVPLPTLQQAARPDDAVLYGCYDLARIRYGSNS